ncbi:uncharacterized protein P174DRAFT_508183 [Aspergillus novofumigatus IBT 16806]|uniref:Uncharacterized protein n=1 Tax=Aspergillus novofumigatus (strain IBT 16806) TaxID=1392255 RepID=A0A2I1BSW7_ASPN1|nr:uncharacterized protein P174DRAFT_508183 [Aspergillus novofumigatus IBT 16806]PKX88488.1 hypothetical protein P174DRAFT_508183 [Aspergillus novofumigatus IBT 16806]
MAFDLITSLLSLEAAGVAWLLMLSTATILIISSQTSYSIGGKGPFGFRGYHARRRYRIPSACHSALLTVFHADVVRISTPDRPLLVLAPKFANEFSNHPALRFQKYLESVFHPHTSGLEVFQELARNDVLPDSIRGKLNRNLNKIVQSLLPKVATPLKEHWTDDAGW